MDEKMEDYVIASIDKLQAQITELRVEVGKIKQQAAIYAGVMVVFSTIISKVIDKL